MRVLLGWAISFVITSGAGAGEVRVETGTNGRSWTLSNGWVERQIEWGEEKGLRTTGFRRLASGTEFVRGREARETDELGVKVDGDYLRGASGAFELLGAEVVEVDRGGKRLDVRLRHREKPIEVTAHHAVYAGHGVVRKWLSIANRGDATATLTRLVVEHLPLAPGRPNELQVDGFYGSAPREIFMSGRVDEGLVLFRNARTGEGLGILNEAPGHLKRTDIVSYDWTSGIRCGYDTDLFPFERSLEPGETFTSAACSIAVFAWGDGLSDPGFVLPSYTGAILSRKGSDYQPPWIYNTWEPFYRGIEETTTRELIDAAAEVGFDVFTIDDGWQKTHGANDVWEETFPSGLEPVRAQAEQAGMRLGLWYPLAAIDTTIPEYRDHPEWVARERDGSPKETATAAGSKVVMCMATPYHEHAARRLSDLIRTWNLAYVKIDLTTIFNTYGEAPGCHAEGHEHRTWAESLARIYEAINKTTALVYEEHPEVLLDLTFELWGKKHLIDPGLLAAGDLDWLSNVHDEEPDDAGPLQARTLLYHRALAVPVEAMLIGNLRMDTEPLETRFATAIGSGPMLLGDPRALSRDQRTWYAQAISWFSRIRRETPLQQGFFPQGAHRRPARTTWDGFARLSRQGEGLLVLFRNESGGDRARVSWPAPESGSWSLHPFPSGDPLGPYDTKALRDGVELPLPARGEVSLLEIRRAR